MFIMMFRARSGVSVVTLLLATLAPLRAQGVLTTIAGAQWVFPARVMAAKDAPLSAALWAPVADSRGNAYFSDPLNRLVMRVSPDGLLTVVAGNGVRMYQTADGVEATNVDVGAIGLAVDAYDNLYIADQSYQRIRKIGADGVIHSVAGLGEASYSGDGGPATAARLNRPSGVAVASDGTLYIADTGNFRIRRVDPSGIISTIAGTGTAGFSGDDGPVTMARIGYVQWICADSDRNIYFTDGDPSPGPNFAAVSRIRRIAADGTVSTIRNSGIATAIDARGNLYFIDDARVLYRRAPDGAVTAVAGTPITSPRGDGGPALKAYLVLPAGAGVDSTGNVWIADSDRLRKVTPDGIIQTVAGAGDYRPYLENVPAIGAYLSGPSGMAVAKDGSLYLADSINRVRKIAPDGTIATTAGSGGWPDGTLSAPALKMPFEAIDDVALAPDGTLYLYGSGLYKVTPDGNASIISGSRPIGPDGGIAVDAGGGLFFTDVFGKGVWKFNSSGVDMQWADPSHGTGRLAFDRSGVLYLAANWLNEKGINGRVERITAPGVVNTVAGLPAYSFPLPPYIEGAQATTVRMRPTGIAIDGTGNIFVSDMEGYVRKIIPDGTIHTVAGGSDPLTAGQNGNSLGIFLESPSGLAFDSAGNLLIAEQDGKRIRMLRASAPAFEVSPADVTFEATADGGPTPEQTIEIRGVVIGLRYSVPAPGASWLHAQADAGLMPGAVRLSADPSGLAPGTYSVSLAIDSLDAAPQRRTVGVTFIVDPPAAPRMNVNTNPVLLIAPAPDGSATAAIPIMNLNSGSFSFTATTVVHRGTGWLTVSPASGVASAAVSGNLRLTANATGLSAGVYTADVLLQSGTGDSASIPVAFTVAAASSTGWHLSQTAVSITAIAGGGSPPPERITLVAPTGAFGVTTLTLGAQGWLSVAKAEDAVTISADGSKLVPGVYHGAVDITTPDGGTPPAIVTVVLRVLPSSQNPGPIARPSAMVFTAPAGSTPASQDLMLYNLGSGTISFISARDGAGSDPWFFFTPGSGTISPNTPARIVVQPKFDSRPAGIYRGRIVLQFSDQSVRSVELSMIIAPGGCTASQTLLQAVSPPHDFRAVVGEPVPIEAFVGDECGARPDGSPVAVEFSNGDPPLEMRQSAGGRWTVTWTPRAAGSSVALRISGGGTRTAITGSVAASAGAPIIYGTLASVLAPGLAFSIRGDSFGSNSGVTLGGQVLAPISSSATVIQAVVPIDTPADGTYPLIAGNSAMQSTPFPIVVTAAQPAILEVYRLLADGSTSQLRDGDPVQAGDHLALVCAGLGIQSGSVSVTVGGASAPITVSQPKQSSDRGYLTNITLQVPGGVMAGADPMVVNAGGYASPPLNLTIAGSGPAGPPVVAGIGPIFGSLLQPALQAMAPGEIVSLYGSQLCLNQESASPTLPDRLGGCAVLVEDKVIPLYFSSPMQINAVLPQDLSPGSHQLVVVRYADGTYSGIASKSQPLTFTVAKASMAFVEIQDSGHPVLAAQFLDGGFATGTRPAQPGDYLTLYLTGLGRKVQMFPEGAAPGVAAAAVEPIQIQVEGVAAEVPYAGVHPSYPGFDQIVVRLPQYALTGKATATIQISAQSASQTVRYEINSR